MADVQARDDPAPEQLENHTKYPAIINEAAFLQNQL